MTHIESLGDFPDFSIRSGSECGEKLLASHQAISAIFASNDEMAIGAIKAVKARGLRVPEDISVVGFDDILIAEAYDPSLTTVAQPRVEIGRRAMGMLCNILEKDSLPQQNIILPTELVVRESSQIVT